MPSVLATPVATGNLLAHLLRPPLIDRGHGLICDVERDFTWLQDANHAKTVGASPDGQMTWPDAMAWGAAARCAWRARLAVADGAEPRRLGSVHGRELHRRRTRSPGPRHRQAALSRRSFRQRDDAVQRLDIDRSLGQRGLWIRHVQRTSGNAAEESGRRRPGRAAGPALRPRVGVAGARWQCRHPHEQRWSVRLTQAWHRWTTG
jgi:hypothetical protein